MDIQQQQGRIERNLSMLQPLQRKIYNLIQQAPSTKKDLNRKTNLPSTQLDKILKELEQYCLIKHIKKPESKALKVYVLYNENEDQLQQSKRKENQDVMQIIKQKLKNHSMSIQQLSKELQKGNPKKIENLLQILQVMKFKGDIYINKQQVKIRTLEFIKIPCIDCELVRLCRVGGSISPQTCPYLQQW